MRYALRTLRKSPGFTVVAVLALAIGIGGNTAIFSLIDAVRSRALPYKDPDALVQLWGNVVRARVERRGNAYPDFLDWRAQSKSFEDMAAFDNQTLTLAGVEDPERIPVEFVSAPYFSLLGVTPARGRTFSADEDLVATPGVRRRLERRPVEAALRRRSGDRRPQRHAERPHLHHRRRDAARLQRPHATPPSCGCRSPSTRRRRRWPAAAIAGSARWRGSSRA